MTTSSLPKTVKNRVESLLGVAALSAIAFVGVPQSAEAASIWRGSDYLTTPSDGTTFYDFGGPIGMLQLGGLPIGPGFTDTIVQRKADCLLPNLGSSCTIPIEMTALSLKSINSVNIGGNLFDIFVTLDNNQASTGSMTINHEFADNGTPAPEGTFSSVLNVNFKASIQAVGGGPVVQTIFDSLQLTLDKAFWSHEPPPGTEIVPGLPGTVIGDNTAAQNANWHGPLGLDAQNNEVGDFFILGAGHTKIGGKHTVCSALTDKLCKVQVPDPNQPDPNDPLTTKAPEPSVVLGSILVGLTAMFGLKKKQQSQKA